jgi:hypothetical protein
LPSPGACSRGRWPRCCCGSPSRVAATLTAFGGGILLAAIAFELVPDADAGAGTMLTADRVVPYAFAEVSSRVATATVLGFVAGYLLS